ncbi:hypothetical protein [Salinimicrobium sp. GXAS 041]|uniref:hypothetical protein n=1 Tax=Salinimicrobium sp. GXAS 041 TaxID=3400806 RepID=UPI003C72521C
MKLVIQLLLWIIIVVLGYLVFNAVYEPIQFNKIKEKRYAKVIENLKDIRAAQMAHRQVTGRFEEDFDDLVSFLDTAQYTLTQRRDTTYLDEEYRRTYGVDREVEDVVIDTLGFASVKDSLFGNSDRFRTMMNVPIEGVDAQFEMDAGTVTKNESQIPVFEARIAKSVVLHDLDRELVMQEEEIVGVDEVPGAFLSVGSMNEVKTSGNWPLRYGDNE